MPTSARAQPTVAGGRVFVGSQGGTVYALDAKTGCTIWTFQAKAGVRTAHRHRVALQRRGSVRLLRRRRANVYA